MLSAGGGGFGGFGGGGRGGAPGSNPNAGIGQNVTPNAVPLRIQPFEAGDQRGAGRRTRSTGERPAADDMAQMRQMAQQFGITIDDTRPRVMHAVRLRREQPAALRHARSTASS